MDIIAVSLLLLSAFLLAGAEFYLKTMAKQLERLEIENESLKTKLEKFTGGKDDQA
nr:MAG TPA: Herpesvirus BLRF2 protein [Caudoviricetes sp.]